MKKTLGLLLALLLVAGIAPALTQKTEIICFAAASMQETLTTLCAMYSQVHPDIAVICNFDSSGTLKTQIEEGAACDLFISAGQKQMNQLDIRSDASVNPGGLDFVLEDSRVDLLENRVVLVTAPGGAAIASFDDLAEKLAGSDVLLAMGNSDVPVGQYTQRIFAYYGLDENALAKAGRLTYGSNVKEVTTQVALASVDCGIVYCTDAFSANLTVVDSATAQMCGQVIYPAALMKQTSCPQEAQAFLNFLQSDEAMAVFESVGFARVR